MFLKYCTNYYIAALIIILITTIWFIGDRRLLNVWATALAAALIAGILFRFIPFKTSRWDRYLMLALVTSTASLYAANWDAEQFVKDNIKLNW